MATTLPIRIKNDPASIRRPEWIVIETGIGGEADRAVCVQEPDVEVTLDRAVYRHPSAVRGKTRSRQTLIRRPHRAQRLACAVKPGQLTPVGPARTVRHETAGRNRNRTGKNVPVER